MKYIAIKNETYEFVTPENEQTLITEGYTLYTEAEYEVYLTEQAEMTDEEILKVLEDKSGEYITFGTNLFLKIKKKVWAVNTLNKSKGIAMSIQDMYALLEMSDILEKTLRTGSLDTAKDALNQLKIALPLYATIADFAIGEINNFTTIGLV